VTCRPAPPRTASLRRMAEDSGDGLTQRVEEWRSGGEAEDFRGHSIHVRSVDGGDPVLVLLHGFPSRSYDFRQLLALTGDRAALTFDFLGFGLSDKPHGHRYSLFWQADLVEELARRHFGGREVFVVAHDMGTSVATELMARDIDGRLAMNVSGALLFNGSIVVERASLTRAQRLLRSRLGPLAARLSNERVFRREFGALFSPGHPLSEAEAEDQWALVCHNGGRTLGHELIAYIGERTTHAERWHGAIRDWPGPLRLAWGMLDPVATTEVLAALRELRPSVPVEEMDELGHYPQLEDPARVADAIRTALAL
jgi:pimeloyl-ACP methyl ester carboxylesterase